MKKFAIIAVALCAAFIMAAPAMAIDADFSGYYKVRGFYDSHYGLRDTDASSAYMDMELELNTVFKATDNLSLTTKIMGLSGKKWGDTDDYANDLDIDHVYMTIKSGIGTFVIGRMAAGTFGTSFVDSEYEVDRIKYTKVIDNLTLCAVYQKNAENDAYLGTHADGVAAGAEASTVAYMLELLDTDDPALARVAAEDAYDEAYAAARATAADEDKDVYWLAGVYKTEDIAAGLLYGFANDKRNDAQTGKFHILDPYFTAKFGPLALQGELLYIFGETDYDAVGQADLDKKELAWNLEATYDLGMASVQAGYAFFSGDVTDDNDDKAFSGWAGDRLWEKLFILTTDENDGLANHLGGYGNLSRDGYADCGANIYYGGASITAMENLDLGLVIGYAEADKVPALVEDDLGIEYDLTLNWKIYDNLTYSAIAAFLDAGDIWQGGDTTVDVKNTYALFHQLELTF